MVTLFFLPIFLVKQEDKEIKNQKITEIRLLRTETGEIETMDLDEYVMGVLIGEMPVTYEMEALKAQAVVARTYALHKMQFAAESHEKADMCDNVQHCQAYRTKDYAFASWDDAEEQERWKKVQTAVLETQDEVITYQGEVINAFFHSHSGGKTEDIVNLWGHEAIPYLKSVEGNEIEPRIETITLTKEELDQKMKEQYANYQGLEMENWQDFIRVLEINSSGRVAKLQIANQIVEGTEARSLFGLRSTMFTVAIDGETITFQTSGYGHGVGMSQVGANGMALQGATYREIIQHYYQNVEIEKR